MTVVSALFSTTYGIYAFLHIIAYFPLLESPKYNISGMFLCSYLFLFAPMSPPLPEPAHKNADGINCKVSPSAFLCAALFFVLSF